jgi:predicted GIY-YIG superfamily endonuclease
LSVQNDEQQTRRRAAVYRLFAADGALLYIGSSYDPDERCESHRRASWWPQVVRRTEEWHPNRSNAYGAETEAIQAEAPRYNRMCTPEYGEEVSRRQLAGADEQRLKCKVAYEANRLRKRVAAQLKRFGYSHDRATAEGMTVERAYKEASGAFPNGVNYPPLDHIEMHFARAAAE